jgi:hypothetical protein
MDSQVRSAASSAVHHVLEMSASGATASRELRSFVNRESREEVFQIVHIYTIWCLSDLTPIGVGTVV